MPIFSYPFEIVNISKAEMPVELFKIGTCNHTMQFYQSKFPFQMSSAKQLNLLLLRLSQGRHMPPPPPPQQLTVPYQSCL